MLQFQEQSPKTAKDLESLLPRFPVDLIRNSLVITRQGEKATGTAEITVSHTAERTLERMPAFATIA